jgi:hypothetical protein
VTRSWRMFAGRPDRVVEGREFASFGDERTVRFNGRQPVEVELTEDADGQYWVWLKAGADKPVMIQPHPVMFRMQSPDGFEQNVARGYGVIVRMSCRAVEESSDLPG